MDSRTYWVGLPVGITVREDGAVSVEIDMGEASSEMRETWLESHGMDGVEIAGYAETEVLADGAVVDAHPGPWTVNLQRAVAEMRCPARWGCGFRTFEIPALVAHLQDPDERHGDS